MNAAGTILVVEDEPVLRHLVRDTLRREDYRVIEASGVADAIAAAAATPPDLVVLDLGLADGDGLRFLEDFRHWSTRPVLVLSARQLERDKVQALDAGADDFLTKPFSVAELLARIRALRRRSEHGRDDGVSQFEFSGVRVDLARHEVTRDGVRVKLSPKEYQLLALLLTNTGKVMTWRRLLTEVWGAEHVGDTHYLRIYIGHLRQKLEPNPTLPVHLLTELGVGYRFML